MSAVSFTGGTCTGELVARAAAPSFKKLSLELGGKNPAIVFDDCNFEKTVKGVVRTGFFNQGQVCLCGSRILVQVSSCHYAGQRTVFDGITQTGIYNKFVERLKEEVLSLMVGDPNDDNTDMGSLISVQHR